MAKLFRHTIINKNGVTQNSGVFGPSDPANLVATADSDTEISLTWDASSPYSNGDITYNIYRDESANPTTLLATVSDPEYMDEGLEAATQYYYAVEAVETAGASVYISSLASDDATTDP